MPDYHIHGEWLTEQGGYAYRVRALDPETSRILAKVQVHVDIDAAHGLQHYLGRDGMTVAEESSRTLVETMIRHRYGDDWRAVEPPAPPETKE